MGNVEGSAMAARNLKREAEERGIEGSRLVFAPFVAEPGQHPVRLSLAGLFFDAHAGGSDARSLKLARGQAQLDLAGTKLKRNRESHPLFDPARFTRNLEKAYLTMWARQRRGDAPASFLVGDGIPA